MRKVYGDSNIGKLIRMMSVNAVSFCLSEEPYVLDIQHDHGSKMMYGSVTDAQFILSYIKCTYKNRTAVLQVSNAAGLEVCMWSSILSIHPS